MSSPKSQNRNFEFLHSVFLSLALKLLATNTPQPLEEEKVNHKN